MMNPDNGTATGPGPIRVLIVDDNAAGRKALAKYLEAQGYEVVARADGSSGLEALRQGPPPRFLLTDMLLPDMDGREIALAARELSPPPRVALITGWDLEGGLEDPGRWGIDWVLPKPLDLAQLMGLLRNAAANEGPGRA